LVKFGRPTVWPSSGQKIDEPLDDRAARRALSGEADLMTWLGVYSIRDRFLIARIAEKVLVLASAGAYTGQAEQEFRGEELLTDAALRLQKTAMPAASGAGHGSTQKSSIFGCYSQIEGNSASRILTGGAVHDSVSGC
jgi:hypothetical protein